MKHRLICCVSSGVTAHLYAVFIKYRRYSEINTF